MRAIPPDGVMTGGSPRTERPAAPVEIDGVEGLDVDGAGVDGGADAATDAREKYASPEV
jgi:hypothetical protein